MNNEFSVRLADLSKEMKFEEVYLPKNYEEILVCTAEINRPGMQIVDYYDHFDPTRLQIIGKVEMTYIQGFDSQTKYEMLKKLCMSGVPAIIVTRNLHVCDEFLRAAKESGTPILRTEETTSRLMSALIAYLNLQLAPRITRHGVLVEVYGEGILILGDSGVGKSETAIELVKRGHRLVADDAVEIKKVSSKTLVASSPAIIRHFIELRGIGIVDVKNIFGMGAVKEAEKIDLVIHLENWQAHKQYDRLGLVNEYTSILDIDIPSMTIPVKPGRNLAIIVEVAAMNNRQKKMGYNAAEELNKRLIADIDKKLKSAEGSLDHASQQIADLNQKE